ncbi:hypothetical protein JTE90_016485 [Oedothorax gibbosus]|uniref:Cytochrome P450 n=1 Tax=Oedothorax gibbosus TaxID=931172 RepID=A0AAV6V736_9ARAC|nr:hypothetical protein JTE90_016485 [Oedothorax gibbosus]
MEPVRSVQLLGICNPAFVLKHIHTRFQYIALPGPKFYLFDFLGAIRYIPWTNKARNGCPLQTMVLQMIEGFARLVSEDLFFFWFGFHPIVIASKPDSIQAVLTDSSLLDKSILYKFIHPILGNGLLTSDGDKWKPRRRLLNPSFRAHVVQEFIPDFNKHSAKLVSVLKEKASGEIVELSTPIAHCVLDIVGDTIVGAHIGAQDNENHEYVEGLRRTFLIAFQRFIKLWYWPEFTFRYSEDGTIFYRSLECICDLRNLVLQRKKKEYQCRGTEESGPKSLMDNLLSFHMEKKNLTEEDIREEVDTFLAAGNESTTASLLFTFYLVGLDKKIQSDAQKELDRIFGDDKLRCVTKEDLAEMSYLECIIKESLRLFPTVPFFGRKVPKGGKTICGFKLPPGTTLLIIPYITHRDPDIFPDPERFDPTRFSPENCANRSHYAYVPFCAGARNCIGQQFAMIEMKVVLAHVLRNFTIESLDPRDKVLAAPEMTLRTADQIRFRVFPRV